MHIAILTFEGFNELDSLVALGILNRVTKPDWRVSIASPRTRVRSMNGVVLEAQALSERDVPDYIDLDASKLTAKMTRIPVFTDVPYPVQMEPHLIVEFYSR